MEVQLALRVRRGDKLHVIRSFLRNLGRERVSPAYHRGAEGCRVKQGLSRSGVFPAPPPQRVLTADLPSVFTVLTGAHRLSRTCTEAAASSPMWSAGTLTDCSFS